MLGEVIMSHFCFGAYTRILLSCAPSSVKNKFLCGTLLLGLDPLYDIREDDDSVSHILGGRQNLSSNLIQAAMDIDAIKLRHYFEREIIHRLDDNKKKNVILALKDIIRNDQNILDSTQLGTLSGRTKLVFLSEVNISFTEVLVDLFLYAVIKTDNTKYKNETKTINRKYCDKYDGLRDTINLYEPSLITPIQAIPLTVNSKKFDAVFTHISKESLGLANNHDFQLFRLAIENNEFCYSELGKFLLNNLGNYVFSRSQIQDILDEDEIGTIAIQAIRLLNDTGVPGVKGTGSELGELLLYVFLEHVLQAPKLMSKVELNSGMSTKRSKSDSIHLLSFNTGLNNQLVLGASHIVGDLKVAIDEAFEHVVQIKNAQTTEIGLVESTIFYQSFNPELSATVKNIIVPQKGKSNRPDRAFGVFLGYSIDKIQGIYTNDEYRIKYIEQMEKDISDNAKYIQDKIMSLGLTGFSFYIYVLPFNEAISDKQAIMDNLLTLGGVC